MFQGSWSRQCPEDPDERMKQGIFKANRGFKDIVPYMAIAMFNKMFQYYPIYLKEGLYPIPRICELFIKDYWDNKNPYFHFISVCREDAPGERVEVLEVYNHFKVWYRIYYPGFRNAPSMNDFKKGIKRRWPLPEDGFWYNYRIKDLSMAQQDTNHGRGQRQITYSSQQNPPQASGATLQNYPSFSAQGNSPAPLSLADFCPSANSAPPGNSPQISNNVPTSYNLPQNFTGVPTSYNLPQNFTGAPSGNSPQNFTGVPISYNLPQNFTGVPISYNLPQNFNGSPPFYNQSVNAPSPPIGFQVSSNQVMVSSTPTSFRPSTGQFNTDYKSPSLSPAHFS